MNKAEIHPLVSVIIPTYNRGWIIQEAVESVLAQDYKYFELIVVDDGSTDHTVDLLRSYGKAIRLIQQENQGVSAARNTGIAEASGAFIAFLDSDDLWLPDKLSCQIDFFNSHPEAMLCQTEEIWMRNRVRVNPKKRHKKPSGRIFEASLSLCLVSPSAVMIKRSLFEDVGLFDETLPACEDYDFWLRVSCRHPIYLIDTPLIIKRGGHDDQLSSSPGLDKYRIQAIRKAIDGRLLSASQFQAAVNTLKQKCGIYAAGCRKRGRLDEAIYYEKLADKY
jgi:glycosyltransferase involved in cell wall biosynthesis